MEQLQLMLPANMELAAGNFLEQLPQRAIPKIQALSWKQPFGSLMLHGKQETRTWHTYVRGLVLICTSKKPYNEAEVEGITNFRQRERIIETLANDDTKGLFGYAIGIGLLVGCRKMNFWDEDDCFVKHQESLWVHEYTKVHRIKPFPWNGVQGFCTVTEAQIRQIEILK